MNLTISDQADINGKLLKKILGRKAVNGYRYILYRTYLTSSPDVVIIKNEKGKYGLLSVYGEFYTGFIYDNLYKFQCNVAKVVFQGKYGVINIKGRLIVPVIFDNIQFVDNRSDKINLIIVRKNQFYGILSISGDVIIPLKYSNIFYFKEKENIYISNNHFGRTINALLLEKYLNFKRERKKYFQIKTGIYDF